MSPYLLVHAARLPNGMFLQIFGVENAFPVDAAYLYAGADASPATAGANLLVAPKVKLIQTMLGGMLEIILLNPFLPWSIYQKKNFSKYFDGHRK